MLGALRSIVLAGGCVLALTSCGGGGEPATKLPGGLSGGPTASAKATAIPDRTGKEWLKASSAAFVKVPQVHVKGSIGTGTDKIALDLYIAGKDAKGVIVGPFGKKPAKIGMIRLNGKLYLRAPEAWTQMGMPASAAKFKDRWFVAPPESVKAFAPMAAFTTLQGLNQTLLVPAPKDILKVMKPATYKGSTVIHLRDGIPDSRAGMYLASVGDPLPLIMTDPDSKTKITFSYPDPIGIAPPPKPLTLPKTTA
ncbi:hypothetical protein [Actinocorallia longicatena]|uniref:Lipoprotein LprG n=1 Tax=Actinocorallia longicatena TaxID=111803 RepID=A0ABP6QKW3_9ACTN